MQGPVVGTEPVVSQQVQSADDHQLQVARQEAAAALARHRQHLREAQTPLAVIADESTESEILRSDTPWLLASTMVALGAALPGLAICYGGYTNPGRLSSMLLQLSIVISVVSLVWVTIGYSLAFSTSGMVERSMQWSSVIGDFSKAGLKGISMGSAVEGLPEYAHVVFQMAFAVIATSTALVGFAHQMKLSAVVVMSALWPVFVYLPVVHAVWAGPGALFGDLGTLDVAGMKSPPPANCVQYNLYLFKRWPNFTPMCGCHSVSGAIIV